MTEKTDPMSGEKTEKELARRKALARLGLAVGALYAAPLVTNLSDARAKDCPPHMHIVMGTCVPG